MTSSRIISGLTLRHCSTPSSPLEASVISYPSRSRYNRNSSRILPSSSTIRIFLLMFLFPSCFSGSLACSRIFSQFYYTAFFRAIHYFSVNASDFIRYFYHTSRLGQKNSLPRNISWISASKADGTVKPTAPSEEGGFGFFVKVTCCLTCFIQMKTLLVETYLQSKRRGIYPSPS